MVVRGWLIGAAIALQVACTETPGADLGETCSRHDECADSAQCFQQTCTPRCVSHDECGAGYVCLGDGTCERVVSQIGDPCARELDCGPRQSCQLDAADGDGDGWLGATCQPEISGHAAGALCGDDAECSTGICSLGRCSAVCGDSDDCAAGLDCVDMPRLLADTAPLFRGCLQAEGRLELAVAPDGAGAPVRVPVPGNALSFAVTAQVDDPRWFVGAQYVEAPDGAVLYSSAAGAANAIRYQPHKLVSTLLIPNAPDVPLSVGAYTMTIAATQGNGVIAGVIPDIRVVYKLGGELSTSTLDLNLYFLDLAEHPCAAAFGGGKLDATSAASAPGFQLYLLALRDTLRRAGVTLGEVTYQDLPGHPELDAITLGELGALLSASTTDRGVNVFFVRSIDPIGVQALSGGTPAPPGIAGTPASGAAISVETLCYRGWGDLARSTAHVIGNQLGLYRNVEPDGTVDAIADSPSDATNLMHFSEFAGAELSQGQAGVLRRSPATR